MVIERSGTLIESASVPRVMESEPVEIQMVAKLMTQRAQECSEGGDLFSDGGFGPDTDKRRLRLVVPKKFRGRAFAHVKRPGRKHTHRTCMHLEEV
jgi:hypothetical protein